jgi:serine/threonine protein phosphatase PrpC
MRIWGFGGTDVGRARDHNEDAFLVDDEMGLYIVCDGVGGHNAGEVASAMAIQQVGREARTLTEPISAFSNGDHAGRRRILTSLPKILDHASHTIYRRAQMDPNCFGMATTAVVFLAAPAAESAFVAHAGDSRLYLLRNERFAQITEDHTLVRRLVKEGRLSPEEALDHPQRNVIIRSVGVSPGVDCETLFIDLRHNDCFILCSDGLTDMVDDDEIAALADRYEGNDLVDALIQRANVNGGHDNITTLVLEVEQEEPTHSTGTAPPPPHVPASAGPVDDLEAATVLAPREDLASGAPHRPAASKGPGPDDTGVFDLLGRVEFLHDIFLFAGLDDQELVKINRTLYEEHFNDGDFIVRKGDKGGAVYIVAHGTARVEKEGVALVRIPPGGYFGELALIAADVRSADVVAEGKTTCFAIGREELLDLTREDPALGNRFFWAFLENLGDRVKKLSSELSELKGGS